MIAIGVQTQNNTSTLITTIRRIPNFGTGTETVEDFALYINNRSTFAVAKNEIFRLVITDTNVVFELLLRGRSFGVGQPTITNGNSVKYSSLAAADNALFATKQDTLFSGTNIKTIGGASLLGGGDIPIPVSGVTTTTLQLASIPTETTAGFVTYLNTLATPLVVATNEIFKLQCTTSGRMFELLLRGRSFGTGTPAITAANVVEITDFLNRDIRLSAYPSTRNDGQLPTNKVLAPDVNGNLKLYTIATAPAPYMEVLIPDSTLPSTTTNFTIKGAFFTPTMTVSIVGQTINYITFVSDNLIKVNVTTSSAEGSYAVTLNNGLSATFPNALLIVLGTVFSPKSNEWTTTGAVDVSENDFVKIVTYNSPANAVWSKTIDHTKNFRVNLVFVKSPMGSPLMPDNGFTVYSTDIWLVKASDGTEVVGLSSYLENYRVRGGIAVSTPADGVLNYLDVYDGGTYPATIDLRETFVYGIRWVNGVLYVYRNSTLVRTLTFTLTEPMKLKVKVRLSDVKNIKYIETA